MQSALNAPHLTNEAAAFEYVEARLWPLGATCPHCGVIGEATRSTGKTTRAGLWNCRACRKPFTVRMGTIFESSHVPLHVWLQVIYLMCSSKKGVSTRQIQRTIGGSMKTAWFLTHRIREAMSDGTIGPFGSDGGMVEVDETFIGNRAGVPIPQGGIGHKMKVLSLVERNTGAKRSMVLPDFRPQTIADMTRANLADEAVLMTDEAGHYKRVGVTVAAHFTVNHGNKEYVNADDPRIHTNTIEGSFSIFKRGMRGIYQHCQEKHLHRYLAEFDFRYSYRAGLGVDDKARADRALDGFAGKRLTYETVSQRRSGVETRVVW